MDLPDKERNPDAASAARWELIAGIVSSAIDQPPDRREEYLRLACAGSPELLQEVCLLLEAHEESGDFLEASPVRERLVWNLEGRQVGPWLLLDKIGEGGMGVVYRGRRRHDDFDVTAAVKVCGVGPAQLQMKRRFRSEVKILASLDHPNITRLLDGGVSDDGVPYLAMEYVAGLPILEHCKSARLRTGERVALMARICRTVHYAHQRLIVHRDIKPSNVMVTADGEPKLLDFGIARLLEPESDGSAATISTCRVASLRYASPEHLRGAKVTTAADVYSLGVLLYEVLTDASWPVPEAGSLEETVAAIETTPPPRPSARIANLDPDLDAIVAKSTRPEPQLRFTSAEEMAVDLERHLRREPVSARRGTALYIVRRFAARHKLAVACTGAALAATIAGSVAVSWQAHIANRERRRSDARFEQTRRLANEFIQQSQTGLREVPGTLKFRRQMTDVGLRYLDALAADSAGDPGLSRELAKGYTHLGQVLGSPSLPNLGDPASARASFRKALQHARGILMRTAPDFEAVETFVAAAVYGNDLDMAMRRFDDVLVLSAEVERRLAGVAIPETGSLRTLATLNRFHHRSARAERSTGDPRLEWKAAAIELEQSPAAAMLPRRLAELFLLAKLPAQAETYARRTLEGWTAGEPARFGSIAVGRHHTSLARGLLGLALVEQGRAQEGLQELRLAVEILSELVEAEPEDSQYKADLAETELNLGAVLLQAGDRRKATEWFDRAVRRAVTLSGQPSCPPRVIFVLGRSLLEQATLAPEGRRRCELATQANEWLEVNERGGVALRSEALWRGSARKLVRGCP